ncbi:MAG: tail assembly protein [Limnohabitans sp.]
MRKVILRGELGRLFGRVHWFDVKTPAEAVRALCANFPGFEQHLVTSDPEQVRYRVGADRRRVEPDQLHDPLGAEAISITPILAGAGSGFWSFVAGVALIGLTIATGGFGGAAIIGGITWAGVVGGLGAALVLGGISQMLAPQPETPQGMGDRERKASYLFDGPVNTTAQGYPVPVGYGRLIIGSAVISGGITVEDIPV